MYFGRINWAEKSITKLDANITPKYLCNTRFQIRKLPYCQMEIIVQLETCIGTYFWEYWKCHLSLINILLKGLQRQYRNMFLWTFRMRRNLRTHHLKFQGLDTYDLLGHDSFQLRRKHFCFYWVHLRLEVELAGRNESYGRETRRHHVAVWNQEWNGYGLKRARNDGPHYLSRINLSKNKQKHVAHKNFTSMNYSGLEASEL